VTTLYDLLGGEPGATTEELRRAYRARASALHPDRSAGRSAAEIEADTAELARLNQAWRVLGDPGRRARYDADLAGAGPRPGDGTAGDPRHDDGWAAHAGDRYDGSGAPLPSPADLVAAGGCLPRSVRFVPWVVLAVVLAGIFVVTAYASHPDPPAPPNVIGECLQPEPGYDLFVSCGAAAQDQVVAERSPCPPGTVAHLVEGAVRFTACLDPPGPASAGSPAP
jgi:hypothetical protein